jgi:predicted nicotinamide N-methyase
MRSRVAPVEWSVAPSSETVDGQTFTLEALPSFEAAWDRLHDEIGGWGTLRAREDLSPMFGVVWGAARVLALHVARAEVHGLRVLELGCGLALPSMIAARRGAEVVASDQHRDVEELLGRNLAHNGLEGRVAFVHLDWRAPVELGRFDRVMASDVLYERGLPDRLAAMFAASLTPDGVGWLTDPGRPWLQEFVDAARAHGLTVVDDVADDGRGTEAFLLTLIR